MKKTLIQSSKSPPSSKHKGLLLAPSPKKEFELLYRERDSDQEQPYQNIIFMKSKKCQTRSKPKPESKGKDAPVQQLTDMVAQIEKQLKEKQRHGKSEGKTGKGEGSGKNLFKNKQIKETFHSKASSRWTKYRKQEALAPQNVRKYKNMLSPTRAPKPKEETQSSKFLRSTQETFRKEKSSKPTRKSKEEALPPFSLAQEYVLLQNNFVELNQQAISLLQLKISSIKAFSENRQPQTTKTFPTCSEFSQCQLQQGSQQILTEKYLQKAFTQEQVLDQEDGLVEQAEEMEEDDGFEEQEMRVMEMYMVSKVKYIQRWWRQVLAQKQKPLDPIVFQKVNEEFEESMLFIHSGLRASEVSPIKMIDRLNADRTQDHPSKERSHLEEKMDPLRLREQAAGQQLQTHLQLLQELLEDRRISSETFFEKKGVIEAKYSHQMQQINQLEKLMSENTQRAYQITVKTQQDRNHLQNLQLIDENTLDQIFGKDFQHPSPIATPNPPLNLPNYQMMIVNRQKSTGCHFDGEEKVKPSIYQKRPQEDYEDDFQEQEQENHGELQEQQGVMQQYNANFTQLLDEYKSRQEVKMEIDRRAAIQMGALIEEIPQQIKGQHIGIDTSLNSIHRFILSFFKFYIFYYKDQFLRLINMPYGYNIDHRLSFLHGYEQEGPEEDENGYIYGLQSVISDEILEEFYEKVYDMTVPMPAARRANFQFESIHNRCLLDCFNEALNHFRPYFLINGPPYPWNHSEKALTFYFIAEENIQEVFEKSQFKLLRWASTLCGIIPGKYSQPCPAASGMCTEQALELYRKNTHPDLVDTREDRLTKNERVQLTQNTHEWSMFDEQSTALKLESSHFVFSNLVEQFVIEYMMGQSYTPTQPQLIKNFDFFRGIWDQSEDEHA